MEKLQTEKAILINKKRACKFLKKIDNNTYICSVYDKRLTEAPWCMSAVYAYDAHALPMACPYVEILGKDGYVGPRLPRDEEEEKLFKNTSIFHFMEDIKE